MRTSQHQTTREREPLIVRPQSGLPWVVLHTAEQSYLRLMSQIHPDMTAEHARDEWPELVASLRLVGPTRRPRVHRYRASGDFDRVYVVVEHTPTAYRVCEVLPEHGVGPTRRPRAISPPEVPTPPPMPVRDGRSRRRPGVVRSADPPATPAPTSPAPPPVDPTILLLAGVEIAGGKVYPSASELARRLRIPVATARAALAQLSIPEHNPREEHAAGVEVLSARPRRRAGR